MLGQSGQRAIAIVVAHVKAVSLAASWTRLVFRGDPAAASAAEDLAAFDARGKLPPARLMAPAIATLCRLCAHFGLRA
jgi:hypothetical protein